MIKELETFAQVSSKQNVELNIKKKQEIEYVLEGTIKPIKSHFIWELNKETGEIKKAEFKRNTAVVFSIKLPPEELIVKSDCVYIPALNAINAKKKYLKNNNQSDYYLKPSLMDIKDLNF